MAERPRFWRSDAPGAAVVRAMLRPLSGLYGAVMRLRNLCYDRGWLAVIPPPVPVIAIGNLTVGGTGKTPLTAWVAQHFVRIGARPGIVLRGVGGDEPLVLGQLVPEAIVEVTPDRVAGVDRAAAAGATIVVLDDAFQHRRAGRLLDIVVWSADAADEVSLVLPAGPLREPLQGLLRADLVVITRKAASDADVAACRGVLSAVAPGRPIVVVRLEAEALVDAHSGARRALASLAHTPVLAVSGVGDPEAFERQVRTSGARVTALRFGDHHAYGSADIADLLARAPADGVILCTLKDAVKLAPLWPASAPSLWYLSQRVTVEQGAESLATMLASVRPAGSPPPRGPQ